MYEQEKSEIQILKTYLLTQIPTTPLPPNDILLSPNSIALSAAIGGLDKELTRMEREERLMKKFTATNASTSSPEVLEQWKKNMGVVDLEDDMADDMEYVKMTKEDANVAAGEDVAMDEKHAAVDEEEWEEEEACHPSPPAKKHARQNDDDEEQQAEEEEMKLLCQKLASSAVARIANANVRVGTPLGALGLALHTALVELTNGDDKDAIFRCTGVPDANVTTQLLGVKATNLKGGGGGGFAPPIRELPRGVLVPPKWEEDAEQLGLGGLGGDGGGGVIAFRYKCGNDVYSTDSGPTNDATTVYLALQLLPKSDVFVTFGTLPSTANDKSDVKQWIFPLGQHVNLDGFTAAKTKNGGGAVSPSLFYVSLSELLRKFHSMFGVLPRTTTMQTCDESAPLGMKMPMTVMGQQVLPFMDTKVTTTTNLDRVLPPDAAAAGDTPTNNTNSDPLLIMKSQQGRGRHGDFEGDLLPGGPQPGGLHELPPYGGGSQVGPNHPMFDRTFGDEDGGGFNGGDDLGFNGGGSFGIPGVGGGMGMRPRFDPFGPPGGPTEPGRGRGPFPGRGSRLGRGRGRGGRGGRMPPPGGFGNPNPDHMTPPGGDYFS